MKGEQAGKTISLYIAAHVLPAIRERLGEQATESACIKQAKTYALAGIEQALKPHPELDRLRFLVSNWQALVNHAEVFAPELLQNDQWCALKADLELRTEQAGVTAFIAHVAEQYRQKIETEEE